MDPGGATTVAHPIQRPTPSTFASNALHSTPPPLSRTTSQMIAPVPTSESEIHGPRSQSSGTRSPGAEEEEEPVRSSNAFRKPRIEDAPAARP